MAKSDLSNTGCGCIIGIILLISFVYQCNDEQKKNSSQNETIVEQTVDEVVGEDTEESQFSEESLKYLNNCLSNGVQPYENEFKLVGQGSRISVKTSASGNDVIAILKRDGNMIRNSYIQAGKSIFFEIPDGTYQIFFYSGQGWNPSKEMPNGLMGGFVKEESYSKDEPQTLSNQILEYQLISQRNGNFRTKASNVAEIFD